ncbi:MAG: PD-(D/E)XK nuclease family protein, partial [Clostridia bacterium]|nr:PD-(D/E)XK nuclease family protein [Clostridia bacterium]
GSPAAAAAARYFTAAEPERLSALQLRAATARGSLSPQAVRALYGERLRLSASRIERFASCRFSYFLSYGLRAKPRRAAELSPPELGTFMHYVLQHTAREAKELGGFRRLDDARLAALTDKYVERYIEEQLGGLEGRGARFAYLFRRLSDGVRRVVADMAAELRDSDFEPLDFELDFSRLGLPPEELPGGGRFSLSGIADRVDGWVHGGRLYLRVVDYKTGKKSFSLSDVWQGLGLQMLLYLFALERGGEALYGMPVSPAGVLYVPARDLLLSMDHEPDDTELEQKRAAALRRSGLLLDSPAVLRAMERGEEPLRIPVKWKNGVPAGEALASAERLGKLSEHIRGTLAAMAGELRRGSICADPYYKGAQENACLWCDYADACRFTEGEGGDRRRYLPKLTAERVWNALEGGGENA